ncbi:M1 family metallopeptidase [Gemmatimonas groenlandica]|uniref:M1 family metallopeptidase n=1 Tax=Gemmatimonas groenlandica TaxID=2732249 RepID=A0A6M4II54_9BACT|nr:M1 family metallopeptidase [Gemmatimonas groenlandica]QJR34300.1 M1 family metallopeptidase [Gemmatimonas groenlandica]
MSPFLVVARPHRLIAAALVFCLAAAPGLLRAQTAAATAASASTPPRAIRRDVPITNTIRRAYAAGTRDSTGRPGRSYWQLRTDYAIDVSLDPATSRLTGKARITVHNSSPDQLRDIGLRLDPNHFLGNAPHAAPWVPAEVTDGMVISRMTIDGKPVNLASNAVPAGDGGSGARAIVAAQQNAANAPSGEAVLRNGRSTSASVRLGTPIAAGANAVLEIEWSHKLPGGPGTGHRMVQRWADTLYQPTQWYPRVAVYDDLRGWDNELYVGPSEFYNNFGTFDVNIDVPAGWIVSGTGVLKNPDQVLTAAARERLAKVSQSDAVTTIVGPDEIGPGQATATGNANGRLVWRFHADTVNDFAWATAKKYVWNATRATIPGKGAIPVHMLFLPGRANLFAKAGEISRHALEFYSKLWFPYQFPQLTLQDGPSSGMEYPMVINSNSGAADHETGHQWWPMVVSNNETWYGWMDEGFNQYMNILSDADAASKAPVFDGLGQNYGRTSGAEAEPPMMWNANYAGPGFYGFTTYQKTPLMLSALGGIVGDSAVQRAHREWAQAWMFKHPSPWDYMFFMNKALGRDLSWFWNSWLFTTESVDGRLASVKTQGIRTTVTVAQDGNMPSPIVLDVKFAAKGPAIRLMRNAVMLDSLTARVTWPVDVWFNGSRTFTADLVFGGRKIEQITLDPARRSPDRNPADNVWPAAAPPGSSPTK